MLFNNSVKEFASYEDNQFVYSSDITFYRKDNISSKASRLLARFIVCTLIFLLATTGLLISFAISVINDIVFFNSLIVLIEIAFIITLVLSVYNQKQKNHVLGKYDPHYYSLRIILSVITILIAPIVISLFHSTLFFFCIAVPGVFLLFSFFSDISTKKRIYTQTTDAKCIGYSRIISVFFHQGTSCKLSPIFEYSINDEKIVAVYDKYVYGWNSKIAIDSITKIHINPMYPYRIYSYDKRVSTIKLSLSLILIALTIYLYFSL